MEGLLVIGIIWFVGALIKEVAIKPAAPGTDYRQANIDFNNGKISARELDRRVTSGYYVKK